MLKKLTYPEVVTVVKAFCPGLADGEIWQKLIGTDHAWQLSPSSAFKVLKRMVPDWEMTAVSAILATTDASPVIAAAPRKRRGRPPKVRETVEVLGPDETK